MLKKQNEAFVKKMLQGGSHYFETLIQGQAPEFFVLSCSDSRVSPSVITQMPLGHLFVHRNIANQVHPEDESFSASLYYALKHLKVKKIVIQGHTGCGGVTAAWQNNDEPQWQKWLNHIRAGLPKDGEYSIDELAKINVLQQVEELKRHPVYQQYGEGVEIIPCLFHLETGELECLSAVSEHDEIKAAKEMTKQSFF